MIFIFERAAPNTFLVGICAVSPALGNPNYHLQIVLPPDSELVELTY